jgi:hypothetical protein
MGLVINIALDEELVIDGGGLAQAILGPVVEESFSFLIVPTLQSEPHIILSLDTEALFPTMHSYPFFNSFAEIDGELFGTNSEGIYRLSGDTDDGATIHTGVIWNKTNFGIQNSKRFRTAIVDGDIDDIVMQSTASSGSALNIRKGNRIPVGRNLYGRDWEIKLAEFERLEAFELIPVILRR